jgi:hypothetical protein
MGWQPTSWTGECLQRALGRWQLGKPGKPVPEMSGEELLGQGGGAVADLRRKWYWELTMESPPRRRRLVGGARR